MLLSLLSIYFVTLQFVVTERISSKLDFGEPSASSHAAISINRGGDIYRPYLNSPEIISTAREVPCVSNDCKNNDSTSATADVVVHVKTQVNVPNVQNGTRTEFVPDVPIIVGGKDIPQYVPVTPGPNFGSHFYPNVANPDVGFNVINPNPIQTGRGFNNYPVNNGIPFNNPIQTGRGFNNYPVNNGIPFNNHHNRYVPELHWYPQGRQGNVQNPLEFTKIFKNTWTSNFPNDWSGYTNKRHTNLNSEWGSYPQTLTLDELMSKWSELLGLSMNKYIYSN